MGGVWRGKSQCEQYLIPFLSCGMDCLRTSLGLTIKDAARGTLGCCAMPRPEARLDARATLAGLGGVSTVNAILTRRTRNSGRCSQDTQFGGFSKRVLRNNFL